MRVTQRDDLGQLYDTLTHDIGHIVGKSQSLAQWKRRSFVRAFIALVEFDTYNRKQRVLYLQDHGHGKFRTAELVLLREIQPEIDDTGKVKEKKKYLRLIDNYRFAIRMFCKATGIEFELPTNNDGWTAFKDTVDLRNRITHPKNISEVEISDEQFQRAVTAYKWFMDNYSAIVTLLQAVKR